MKLRARIVYGLSVLCAVLTVACSAGTPSENGTAVTAVPTEVTAPAETSTATVAPTVVPTAAVTPTVTVTPTATITPTPTPTEAKVFEIGSAE